MYFFFLLAGFLQAQRGESKPVWGCLACAPLGTLARHVAPRSRRQEARVSLWDAYGKCPAVAQHWPRMHQSESSGGKEFTHGARTLQACAEFNTEFNTESVL